MQNLQSLFQMNKEVINHLAKQSSEDQAYESARELTTATWGQELASALVQVDSQLSNIHEHSLDKDRLISIGSILKSALRNIWKNDLGDPFDMGSQDDSRRICAIVEEIGTVQSLRNLFPVLLNVIVSTLDAPAIFLRTKALRALGQVVTVDASALSSKNVRVAIESHLLDSSSAVRDAAVELIGKYMLESEEVADVYFHKLADRIVDTGVSVRKRVLKLLRNLYSQTLDYNRQIEIAVRLAQRVSDEDDGVKELAVRTLQEIWFEEQLPLPTTPSRNKSSASNTDNQMSIQNRVVVIMGVAANRHTAVETLLHTIIGNKSGSAPLLGQYSQMCQVLIEGLIDATDLPGFSVYNCVKTLYLFTSAYPPILHGSNLSNLLPYLNTTSSVSQSLTVSFLS
jgi:cohesin loading factor subunit SCC2